MQEPRHDKHYSAADLERYHSGEMSGAEMHALEKAALEDPFLADALEGYLNTGTPEADIIELKKRLEQNASDKKIIPIKRKGIPLLFKIAAVLVLFAGLLWLYNRDQQESEVDQDIILAQETKVAEKEQATSSDLAVAPVVIERADSFSISNKVNAKEKLTIPQYKNEWGNVPGRERSASLEQISIPESNLGMKADSTQGLSFTVTPSPAQSASADNALAGKVAGVEVRQNNVNQNAIRGRVTDNNGNPVSYANVMDRKNNQNIATDKDGAFTMNTNDPAPRVEVNAVGYETVTADLDKNNNAIVLKPSQNALSEVVVTGMATKRKSAKEVSVNSKANTDYYKINPRVTITNAIPLNGWDSFNNFIRDSLKTLQQLGESAVSAEVTASFKVNRKGEAIDIFVDPSLCNSCAVEAKRIISSSPPWKQNNRRKKARALFKF